MAPRPRKLLAMTAKQPTKLGFRQQLEAREKECFQFLNRLSLEREYVLIGGYAVSSYHFPRYSADLDIVVEDKEAGFFLELARSLNYKRSQVRDELEPVYGGRSETLVKDIGFKVGIDLLVNSVQSRQTGCAYSFRYLLANSQIREIRGRGLEARATARVADKEMLIALKAQPMRPQDMGDIIVLCYEKPDETRVITHLKKCPRKEVIENIEKLRAFVEKPKTDSVRGAFSFGTREFKQCIENCQSLVLEMNKSLSELSKTVT
ncbi:MAG TPA: hypothetical protein VI816_04940 [Candidatus Bathyarchaeia archaeon]|nr:hypothetical protein [Candidatus Bathyarchaeia archaeon]